MATTYIHTNDCPRVKLAGAQGEVSEIVNKELCGAENVVGMLRWLHEGERFDAESLEDMHQLIYLIEGDGVITLKDKEYEVLQGAGRLFPDGPDGDKRQRSHADTCFKSMRG